MPGEPQPPPPKPRLAGERILDLLWWNVAPSSAALALGTFTGVWWPAYLTVSLALVVLCLDTLDRVLDWIPRAREKLKRAFR